MWKKFYRAKRPDALSGDLFGGRAAACLALFAIKGHYALRGFCYTSARVTRIGQFSMSEMVFTPAINKEERVGWIFQRAATKSMALSLH
jgi:hypothetical protein